MVYYLLGVGAGGRCHCPPILLHRRAPLATAATPLRRQPLLQLRPLASLARRRTRCRCHTVDLKEDDGFLTLDLEDFEGLADEEAEEGPSPWEGVVVYQRDAAVQHIEYATTLERLGLADLSSQHSLARAAAMGIASPRPPRGSAEDTTMTSPVLVSLDVTRRRGRLRLDGILRTVITLGCYR
ncbi:large ribosomal RNA subunit accumulation protein YCED homolog 1, chloroplastic-like [Triticum dicoccoides]|uniref:large ribosomal RNA subunit accumulation protein YCED homolog 1, chloroplastic-like n=1 Tax=Triticum dicoccoides TaxID=85692 RepID=UPI001891D8CD|nr:large ribosomal RNA subunit accumulation protein YCED homolog 1, chloroplastic-like [Triticum dicoccoides]